MLLLVLLWSMCLLVVVVDAVDVDVVDFAVAVVGAFICVGVACF